VRTTGTGKVFGEECTLGSLSSGRYTLRG